MESNQTIQQALERYDSFYDPAACALQLPWEGNGYHSLVPNGQLAHPILEAFDYALLLLASGDPEHLRRAEDVLGRMLSFQDLDPCRPTYGIWPYLCEESLEEMAPPDWNWADFCGIRLAHMVGVFSERLSPNLREKILAALEAAAYSIFRRNVGPGYTNITVKGAIVCGLVGEKMGNRFLMDYAVQRLEAFIDSVRHNGGLHEYNSPNYGMLVLCEVERGLFLLQDQALSDLLRRIHRICWELFSHSIHLGTGQISGPQSRAYQDLLHTNYGNDIGRRLDCVLFAPVHRSHNGSMMTRALSEPLAKLHSLIPALPCPPEIRERIVSAPTGFARHTYVRSEDLDARRVASIWKTEDLCLGSIDYDNLWTQRRPLLGHWRVQNDVAVLRVRMKRDGIDFASGAIRTVQNEGSLLSVVSLATNKGFYHDHLDRTATGAFEVNSLEVSIELTLPGAAVSPEGESFLLSAGTWSAHVHPLYARFGDLAVQWQFGTTEHGAHVRAVINGGRPFMLDPRAIEPCAVAFALTVMPAGQTPTQPPASAHVEGDRIILQRNDGSLSLTAPLVPHPVRDHFTK